MSNPLHQYKFLIADEDHRLSLVLKTMLGEMGFTNAQVTRSGQDVVSMLADNSFDFLITEWNIQHFDGIELISRIRRDSGSPNPTLPIIMLTGRAEQSDVIAARDNGINEYVIKPFSAKTIYNRLERIVEFPRNFVAARDFIGPDRRHKSKPPEGISERRKTRLIPQAQTTPARMRGDDGRQPKLWLPDYSLKRKLGPGVTLPSLVTPAALGLAQSAIDAVTQESLQWIRENLVELTSLHQATLRGDHSDALVADMGEVALTVRARAGTFGYLRASEVAYMLYLFCRSQFRPTLPIHQIIAEKHIAVLQVMLGNDMRGGGGPEGALIVKELQKLTNKYAA